MASLLTRTARSVFAPRHFSTAASRAIVAPAFSHGPLENPAAAAWMRFPFTEFALGGKRHRQEEEEVQKTVKAPLPFPTDMFFQRRGMMLGTVAPVPGMVGGMLLHSKSLQRSLHSNAPLKEAEKERIQPQMNILRPLSPHLPVYKPESSSTFSILHRISVAYLTTFALTFYLLYMKVGMVGFTYPIVYKSLFFASKLHLISVELAALALLYHIYASLRHL